MWPAGPDAAVAWAALGVLGAGPTGLAFAFWDHGVKRGNLRVLGLAAFGTPVLSTLLLIAGGRATAGPGLLTACALIAAGALVASWTRPPRPQAP